MFLIRLNSSFTTMCHIKLLTLIPEAKVNKLKPTQTNNFSIFY